MKKTIRHKAPGLSELVAEMIQATKDIGTQWILDLCNGIVTEGWMPEDWKSSVVLPIYKGKGDPMECGSYRGIKLLEHAIKVVERIFEHRIRQQIDIDVTEPLMPFLWQDRCCDTVGWVTQLACNICSIVPSNTKSACNSRHCHTQYSIELLQFNHQSTTTVLLTAMRFSKCGLGVTGMLPPRLANFCSSDFCTLSVHKTAHRLPG